jgi:hypothetical protein
LDGESLGQWSKGLSKVLRVVLAVILDGVDEGQTVNDIVHAGVVYIQQGPGDLENSFDVHGGGPRLGKDDLASEGS